MRCRKNKILFAKPKYRDMYSESVANSASVEEKIVADDYGVPLLLTTPKEELMKSLM